jgi:uncharacterized damage-inducible protein DinB
MRGGEVLDDACARIPEVAHHVVDGLDADALVWRPDPGSNPIAWLLWHLARVQDDHVADLAGTDQEWVTGSWAPRFALDEATMETGFGHTIEQVAAVRPDDGEVLTGYLDAVTARTRDFLATVADDDLDRVIDTSWDPPVTMGTRLVSVIDDGAQHVGQASYVRGLLDRSARTVPRP